MDFCLTTYCPLPWTNTRSTAIAWVEAQWLGEVIQEGRLVTHFQPIVYSTRPGDVFGYDQNNR